MNRIKQTWEKNTKYMIYSGNSTCMLEITDGEAYIYGLFVDPEERGKGLSKKLMEEAEKIAKEEGCKTIGLNWNSDNSEPFILEMYKKLGYKTLYKFEELKKNVDN